VTQKEAWYAKSPVVETGGVLSTSGNLVFQGRADGILVAYRATDGKKLWQFDAGTGIMAPPVTYTVNAMQYVTVMAGWGDVRAPAHIEAFSGSSCPAFPAEQHYRCFDSFGMEETLPSLTPMVVIRLSNRQDIS
jgi:hypothetical protein